MILFILLVILGIALVAFLLATIIAGGVAAIVTFADVIVCVFIIFMIARWIYKRKKSKL